MKQHPDLLSDLIFALWLNTATIGVAIFVMVSLIAALWFVSRPTPTPRIRRSYDHG